MRLKGRMRFLPVLVSAALALPVVPLGALDWPVKDRILTGTFGEDRSDHFNLGIDLAGEQEVRPVLGGELVFRYDEGDSYSSVPRGLGSLVVLHHSQNILSFYCHLQKGSLGPIQTAYTPSDRIGIIGDTGHSDGKHLHFAVYDEEAGSWINPLTVLPPLPDTQEPIIKRVMLSVGEQVQPLQSGTTVKAGHGEILVEAYDLREDVRFHWPLAPYSVRFSLDGKEVARILFDSILASDGKMVVGGTGLTRENVYRGEGLMRCGAVDLRTGESRLHIAVRDFAGNETVRDIPFTVAE